MVNIHITFLSWMIELFSGLLFVGGTHILGHENHIVTFCMHILGHVINFIILPAIYLVNDEDTKTQIIQSAWYNYVLDTFKWQYSNQTNINDNSVNVHDKVNENENLDVVINPVDRNKDLNEESDDLDRTGNEKILADRNNAPEVCNESVVGPSNKK